MRDFNLSATVDLKIQKFKAKAEEAQEAIKEIEDEILRLSKLKLDVQTGATKGSIKKINQLLSAQNIELKEQGLILSRNNAEQRKYVQSLKSATGAQSQFRSQVGASNSVALEFNRIIQDAPFGIVGIGNNIQQLTANFAQLQAGSASTGQAIVASLKSIVSPINLVLLGVSAVTSLWTAYQLGVFDSAEETDRLAERLDNLADSLNAVQQAQLNATEQIIDQGTEATALLGVLTDLNNSEDIRVRAYERLEKVLPSVISLLDKEKLLAGDTAGAYEEVNKQLRIRAEFEAFNDLYVDSLKEKNKLLLDEEIQQKKILEQIQEIEKLQRGFTDRFLSEGGTLDPLDFFGKDNLEALGKSLDFAIDSITEPFKAIPLKRALDGLKSDLAETQGFLDSASERTDILEGKFSDALLKFLGLSQGVKGSTEDVNGEILIGIEYASRLGKLLSSLANNTLPDISLGDTPPVAEDADVVPLGQIEALEAYIAQLKELRRVQTDRTRIEELNIQIEEEENNLRRLVGTYKEVAEANDLLLNSFTSFASGVVASLNISSRGLRGFLTTLVSAVPQIVNAIRIAQQAKEASAKKDIALSAQQALVNSALIATEGAKALGPVGLALLPVFLAGASALVGSYLQGAGAGGGGGGSGFAGASAGFGASSTSFTGGGLGFQGFSGLNLTSRVSGTDLILVIDRSANTDI